MDPESAFSPVLSGPFAIAAPIPLELRQWENLKDPGAFDVADLSINPRFGVTGSDLPAAPIVSTPERLFASFISEDLASRYAEAAEDQSAGRLEDLANGVALRDYKFQPERIMAMQVRNDIFEGSVEGVSLDSAERIKAFMATPDGIKAMAQLSPDQVIALNTMISRLDGMAPAAAGAAGEAEQADAMAQPVSLDGIPSLSFRAEPAAGQAPQSVRDVGTGQNLLLAGWEITLDDAGSVIMFQDGDLHSGIAIAEGMVMGALGSVSRIQREGDDLVVKFQSGDELRSPAFATTEENTSNSNSG